MARPVIYMIAGPNGAGKTTFYESVLAPSIAAPFINADLIQRDELKDPSLEAAYRAARMADDRRDAALRAASSFVTETTFSHPSKLELLQTARAAGFLVVTYHVNVRSPELSILRVRDRVKRGGHDVPETKIRERYERNQALIRQAILMSGLGFVYDNSRLHMRARRAIRFADGRVVKLDDRVPAWARTLYAAELSAFSPARLNPEAASYADARDIAARLTSPGATIRVATPPGPYRGPVVGESSMHWLQQIGDQDFVAHLKDVGIVGSADIRIGGLYRFEHPQGEAPRVVSIPAKSRRGQQR